jgi:Tfp pilus assembly protein PilN
MKIFLNLLPPQRKQELVNNYYWQFFLIKGMLVLLAALLLVAVALLIQGRVYLSYKQVMSDEQIGKSEHQIQYDNFETKFEETNGKVQKTQKFFSLHTSFSGLLSDIENLLPAGVRLEKLSTKEYTVFLTGVADTRETFLEMEENIKKNTCFESLNTPLSNIFSETNVQFTLDFAVKQECLRGNIFKL